MIPLSLDPYMIFYPDHDEIINAAAPSAAAAGLILSGRPGHQVASYRDLLKKVAALGYHNSRFRLLFRGQRDDYKMNITGKPTSRSCLYPSIFRHKREKDRKSELRERFEALAVAEEKLKSKVGWRTIYSNQIVRWAILQHYEVVKTPLLDVTQSLQTALSFALSDNADEGYLFVLAFPQLTDPIPISIETMTQVVDLTQVCPPEALRRHFQSGLLVGDYPVVDRVESSHGGRGMIGNNFSCRLLTKFKLTNGTNWNEEGFVRTRNDILFPDSYDTWFAHIASIRTEL